MVEPALAAELESIAQSSLAAADANPVKIPMDPNLVIDDDPDPNIDIKQYQKGVGSLIWLTTRTRPDLARAVAVLS